MAAKDDAKDSKDAKTTDQQAEDLKAKQDEKVAQAQDRADDEDVKDAAARGDANAKGIEDVAKVTEKIDSGENSGNKQTVEVETDPGRSGLDELAMADTAKAIAGGLDTGGDTLPPPTTDAYHKVVRAGTTLYISDADGFATEDEEQMRQRLGLAPGGQDGGGLTSTVKDELADVSDEAASHRIS